MDLKKTVFFSTLLGLLLFSKNSYGQHNHGSHGGGESHVTVKESAPNGGEIKENGKYKVELVTNLFLKKNQLEIYLYKRNYKSIANTDVKGTITIIDNQGNKMTQNLEPNGTNSFVAQHTSLDPFEAIIEFIVNGKQLTVTYIHKGLNNNNNIQHNKSNHSEHNH